MPYSSPHSASSPHIYEMDCFDPDALARTVTNADIEIEQMKPGAFHARITAIPLPQSELVTGRLSQAYRLQGTYPPGVSIFSFWLPGTSPMSTRGVDFEPIDTLIFGQNGAETEMLGNGINHYGTFAIAQSRFLSLAESVYEIDPETINADVLIMNHCEQWLTPLRHTIQELQRFASSAPDTFNRNDVATHADQTLTDLLLQALQQQSRSSTRKMGATFNDQQKILRKVHEYIRYHSDQKCTLTELCQVAGTSKRSLQYAFQNNYDLTPMSYLKSYRLNQTRGALLRSDPESTTVTEIAFHHGCYHLGRFAQEYKHHFGESPSETLKKSHTSTQMAPRMNGMPLL